MQNVGVVGLGKMGILHSGILSSLPDARVKAICEREVFLARAARVLLPKTVAIYRDHMKMEEKEDLDAVFITTPIDTHSALVADFARADRDLSLFLEKPLASSSHEAKEACEAVRNSHGAHMVGFQKRFSPIFQLAKELLDGGSVGELMFFKASSFSSDVLREGASWRFSRGGGGVLLDLAPHVLDILLWLFGEPSSVMGVKKHIYSREVDDYVHVVMSFESGLKGHIDACWSVAGYRLPELSIEVHGKDGIITVTDDFVRLDNPSAIESGTRVWYKQSLDTSVSFLLADPEYTKEDEAFLRHAHEQTLPGPNFFEAARVNELIDRITKSAEGGLSC